MSGRCSTPPSASSGCRSGCAPTTARPLPRAAPAGCRRLSVKVIKAGVAPERIAPGKPQQNGRLERLHLTLLQDTASPPARSLREQLERFAAFQRLYNEERPHQALGNATPAEHYRALAAALRRRAARARLCGDHEVRRVRSQRRDQVARQARPHQRARWPASRSASPKPRTAPGTSATARSRSASSLIAATA